MCSKGFPAAATTTAAAAATTQEHFKRKLRRQETEATRSVRLKRVPVSNRRPHPPRRNPRELKKNVLQESVPALPVHISVMT